jgi:putative lipoic acid-binding regulatory protein
MKPIQLISFNASKRTISAKVEIVVNQ